MTALPLGFQRGRWWLLLGATSGKLLLQLLVPLVARIAAQDVLDLSLDMIQHCYVVQCCWQVGIELWGMGCSSSS